MIIQCLDVFGHFFSESVDQWISVNGKILRKIAEATGVDFDWLTDSSMDRTEEIVWRIQDDQVTVDTADDTADDKADARERPEEDNSVDDTTSDIYVKTAYSAGESGESGERVKSLRMGRSLTQEQFAKPLDITQGYLALIESGKVKLSERVADKIEEIYDAGAEWLLTGNDRNRICPVDDKMIEWLKNHQRARENIRRWMDGEEN